MDFPPLAGHLPLYAVVAVVFVVMVCVLVFAHEAGHYLFARLFKMGVEEFAIGFGKKPILTYGRRKYVIKLRPGEDPHQRHGGGTLGAAVVDQYLSAPTEGFSRVARYMGSLEGGEKESGSEDSALSTYDRLAGDDGPVYSTLVETANGPELHEETHFTVRPIPAGGFVRIKGMMPEEDGSETKIPGGFYSKPPWQRLIVLLAGPAFSVLAGILILVPVFMVDGLVKAVQAPVLGHIDSNTPAERAHLKEGDRILAVQGKQVTTFSEVAWQITHSNGQTLTFDMSRNGKQFTAKVTPALDPEPTEVLSYDLDPTPETARQFHIGTRINNKTIHPGFGMALSQAIEAPIVTVVGIARVFQKPARFKTSISGPGQMVGYTAIAVQDGIVGVLKLAAILSISVGIFNLLPFPPLDGGQMVIAFWEMLRGGRRLSMQIQGLVSALGLLAVCSLILGALYVDFQTLTGHGAKPEAAPAALPAKAPLSPVSKIPPVKADANVSKP